MAKPVENPVVLRVNVIADGRFISAGEPTPFSEQTLPAHLRGFVADGGEDFYNPSARNIYGPQAPSRGNVQWMPEDDLVEELNKPLPPDVAAALEDQHSKHIARLKAIAECNNAETDAIYEAEALRAAEAEAKASQLFVRRGGEWGKTQNSKLRPGEHVFVRRENGEMETVGVVDSRGEPPLPEIYL